MTKQTFSIIKSDKEILIFPILASVFSLIYIALLAVPLLLTDILTRLGLDKSNSLALWGVIFIVYLGLAFISTFFNVAVVYCAKKRFEGGDPTFGEGLNEAFKRIHLIFMWSIVSATVGLLLRMLESAVNNSRSSDLTKIIGNIIISLLGTAWSIVSIFVVPAIVFENVGPFAALKSSVATIKKTWGESLTKHYGLGLAEFVFLIVGAIVFLVPAFLLLMVIPLAGIIVGCLFVVYAIAVVLVFSTADTVFNTALFMYASKGVTPKAYQQETMKGAFARQN